ncbi:hypothetical protein [Streptomyces anulatus]|uniref:hypothetical protein n=1 Tax=Streptomyces anulatus TaxID=1892 RepID=UPI00068A90D1|nr:hypothetical protein [Streptomyces anulatus]
MKWTALHGELTQTRLKILETIQGGITGLREENREVRRRQDRMISDLNETRGELRQLLELADTLRPLAELQAAAEEPGDVTGPYPPAEPAPDPDPATGPTAPAAAQPPASPDTDSQGGTMEYHEHQAQPEPERGDQDGVLKQRIEAAYRGSSAPTAPPAAASPSSGGQEADLRVTHGVLLLKAAGVASVDLVAHRDTWEWLTALAVDHDHFRTPPSVEDVKEGRIQTVLSGRSLIGLLIKLGPGHHHLQPHRGRTHRRRRTRPDDPHRPGRRTSSRERRLNHCTPGRRPSYVRAGAVTSWPWHNRRPAPITDRCGPPGFQSAGAKPQPGFGS